MLQFTVIGINDHPHPYFPKEVEEIIASSRVFSGGSRHHEIMADRLPEGAEWIKITVPLAEVFRRYSADGRHIVVFASGDPLFYGFATTLKRKFPEADIRVFPTFHSLQSLAHRLVLPYQDLTLVSLTGRPWNALDAALIEGRQKIGCLTDRCHTPSAIASRLLDYGYSNYEIAVGEHLGNPDKEHVETMSLNEAAERDFLMPNCCILMQKHPNRKVPMGIPDEAFAILEGRPRMITKMPFRLLSIQELGLQSDSVLWDVGFCTGSISIEAKRLFPSIDVIAFEIRKEGEVLMRENTRRFGTPGILPVISDFMTLDLSPFPAPTNVFIGGHGGKLKEMMARICEVLKPGGCIVMNCVTAESSRLFDEACTALPLSQQASISISLNDYNPITIKKCIKQ